MSTSPYEPPKSSLIAVHHSDLSRHGRYVVLNPATTWPDRCFKCNRETNIKKEVRLSYVNPWIYLSILINLLLTLILIAIYRKNFSVNFPLCEHHLKRRKNLLIFQWTMAVILTVGIVIGWIADIQLLLFISGLVFLIIVISSLFGRLAFVAKYKKERIWITGAGKNFRNSLPDFVG